MAEEILPPAKPGNGSSDDGSDSSTSNLYINQFHYRGNDLTELRKMSETNPELAQKVVENADRQDTRRHASERFGIVATLLLLVCAMLFVYAVISTAGFWHSLFAIMLILAIGVLVRVIITGEWSDTTWFGKFVLFLSKALGSVDNTKDS